MQPKTVVKSGSIASYSVYAPQKQSMHNDQVKKLLKSTSHLQIGGGKHVAGTSDYGVASSAQGIALQQTVNGQSKGLTKNMSVNQLNHRSQSSFLNNLQASIHMSHGETDRILASEVHPEHPSEHANGPD